MENKMETWSQRIDRYISEGRTVSGGCGPSDAAKNINDHIKQFATDVASQGKQIFGDASSVFNNLMGSLQNIVKGGPTQQGWGAAESSAVNAQIVDQAAISSRNIKSSVNSALAASGGGNTVSPSGIETAVNLQTASATEAEKSNELRQATQANYETGRQNYFTAVNEEAKLPDVFNSSISANKNTADALKQEQTSQAGIDKADAWWQPLVMGAVTGAESFLTGGLSGMASGTGFLKGATSNLAESTANG